MKPTLLILSIFIIYFLSCDSPESKQILFPDGGYKYLTLSNTKDSSNYKYPLRTTISTRDSLNYSLWEEHFYKSFDEPNLSLSSPKKPVFRFIFSYGNSDEVTVISLYEDKFIVKEAASGVPYLDMDSDKLDSIEKKHFRLLRSYFPLDQFKGEKSLQKHFDSLIAIYPRLQHVNYYQELINKTLTPYKEKFSYNERVVKISSRKYHKLINKINESGYWNLEPEIDNCDGMVIHPIVYSVEAATPDKYNYVRFDACQTEHKSGYKLEQVCIEIEEFLKIKEYHEKRRMR